LILPQHGHGDSQDGGAGLSPSGAPGENAGKPATRTAPKLSGENSAWPRSIAVVGLGLLGASLCEAARRRHPGVTLFGVSSPKTVSQALAEGIIDEGGDYAEINSFAQRADLVVLCTPIDHILGILQGWAHTLPTFKPETIVTDVGSTKAAICEAAALAFGAGGDAGGGFGTGAQGATFIGSHPMAGSEKSGLNARDGHLFENACWIVCPDENVAEEASARLAFFLESLGARLVQLTPDLHDAAVAHVSHLPQLLSTALAAFLGSRENLAENGLQIAGGGFRDMTRLAASRFEVWDPILRTNKDQVLQALSGYRELLQSLESALGADALGPHFEAAQKLRARLQIHRKGLTHALCDVVVDLEDKPGALLAVLKPLAEAGLNVLDCEILKVREGEEGVLLLAFANDAIADAALARLHLAGKRARRR
jgi:prephenate dehydrogenase